MVLRPAEADTGIVFKRTDLPGLPLIQGDVYNVVDTRFCTTLGQNRAAVSTVEHLLSALAGMSIDNAIIEVDAPEIPIMDGSSIAFLFLLRHAGVEEQSKPRQFYVAKRELVLEEDDKWIKMSPSDVLELSIDFSIEFEHPAIGRQKLGVALDEANYIREISRARTFGFLADMRKLHEAGLALGGSLENAVVLDDYNVINKDGLRFKNEFVRHKILDFVGDLALMGRPVLGRFAAHKSGHDLNNRFFRKFLSDPQSWQLITAQQLVKMIETRPNYGNLAAAGKRPS
jgi:UDP-3-O-[3-hydroxymyristoyl] N-acetylglucosamine deacetylase